MARDGARDLAQDWMWSEACEMLARAERLHRELFRPGSSPARAPAWEPPVDILETETEVLALVALPGVDAEDAQAVIEDGDLVIAGTRVAAGAVAHCGHPPARTAAGAFLPPAAPAGGALQRCTPLCRRRMSRDQFAESVIVVAEEILAKNSPSSGSGGGASPPLPPDALIIVPVRNTVLFPGVVLPIALGRPKSVAAAQQAVRDQRQVGILLQRAADMEEPSGIDMHRMGTLANILRFVTAPDGTHHLVCQGEQRFQIVEYLTRLAVPGGAGVARFPSRA